MIGIREIKICAQRIVRSSIMDIIWISSMLSRLISRWTTTVYRKEASG